jgi:hypothetical protein
VSGLTFGFAVSTDRLFFDDTHAGSIHFDVEDGYRLADDDGQIQLHGALDLLLLTPGDILSDGFRVALDTLGGHLQIGQQFHLLSSMIESCVLSNQCLHATDCRREFRVSDIEFYVDRKLSLVTLWAQIVRAQYVHPAHGRQYRLASQLAVMSFVATAAGQAPLFGGRSRELQQLAERCSSGMMHGRADRHLDGLQVKPRLALVRKDDA